MKYLGCLLLSLACAWVGAYQAIVGASPEGRYAFPEAGIARDTMTKLDWQRSIGSNDVTFQQADDACKALSLGGGGWRVPNVKELNTLVDTTRMEPAIDTKAFPDTPQTGFWTSTVHAEVTTWAWVVDFRFGPANGMEKTKVARVRCVRGATP